MLGFAFELSVGFRGRRPALWRTHTCVDRLEGPCDFSPDWQEELTVPRQKDLFTSIDLHRSSFVHSRGHSFRVVRRGPRSLLVAAAHLLHRPPDGRGLTRLPSSEVSLDDALMVASRGAHPGICWNPGGSLPVAGGVGVDAHRNAVSAKKKRGCRRSTEPRPVTGHRRLSEMKVSCRSRAVLRVLCGEVRPTSASKIPLGLDASGSHKGRRCVHSFHAAREPLSADAPRRVTLRPRAEVVHTQARLHFLPLSFYVFFFSSPTLFHFKTLH